MRIGGVLRPSVLAINGRAYPSTRVLGDDGRAQDPSLQDSFPTEYVGGNGLAPASRTLSTPVLLSSRLSGLPLPSVPHTFTSTELHCATVLSQLCLCHLIFHRRQPAGQLTHPGNIIRPRPTLPHFLMQ